MFITVFVTVPNNKIAQKITRGLLSKRLCACVNIIKNIESFFWWENKIDKAKEYLLIMKTKKTLFNKLNKEVLRLHPYKTPEIIAFKVAGINKDYASWLKKETRLR